MVTSEDQPIEFGRHIEPLTASSRAVVDVLQRVTAIHLVCTLQTFLFSLV